MDDRKNFLRSKLDTTENIFDGNFVFKPNHRWIIQQLADKFSPSMKVTEDILKFVTDKELNLCRMQNIMICYNCNAIKMNTLKIYLMANFLVNWRDYNEYIYRLVPDNFGNNITYDSTSIGMLCSYSLSNNYEELNKIRDVDILFLDVSKKPDYAYGQEYYKSIFKTTMEMRYYKGLITILTYSGTEKEFSSNGYASEINIIPYYTYDLTGKIKSSSSNSHNIKSNKQEVREEEIF